jgi:hypothetical protein
MAAIGYGSPNVQLFDHNGDPLAGGLLYAYQAGTDTPQNTWTSSDLDIANTNPVELDSAGRAVIYLSPTPAYKFILKTALGVTITTQDNVSPAAVAT